MKYTPVAFQGVKSLLFCIQNIKGKVFAGYGRTLEELDAQINDLMRKSTNEFGLTLWECVACGKPGNHKSDMSRHIESTHIEHPGVCCHLCGKLSKTRNALRAHIATVHKDV